jgi:hypothetical protein
MTTAPILGKHTRILLYGSTLWYLGEGMLGPIFGIFTERIGGSILDISWIWAAYLMAAGSCTILVGRISDARISKEKLLMLGYVLNTLCTFGYLFASTPLRLLVVQLGLGFASALATPTWDALYTRHQDADQAGYVWGLAGGQAELVTGIAMLLGGLIVNTFSFTALFLTMGIVQTVATLYQAQILYARSEDRRQVTGFYAIGTPAATLGSGRYHLEYDQPSLAAPIVAHSIVVRFKDEHGRVVDVLYAQREATEVDPNAQTMPAIAGERRIPVIPDRVVSAGSASW